MGRHALGLLALLVAALALVGAGCGGNGEASSTEEWAEEFCTLVNDWENELDGIGEDLEDDLSRDSIQEAAEDADSATGDFVDDLRALGRPDTESGDVVEQEIEELGDAVDAEREEIRQAVEGAEDLGDIAQAFGEVGESIAAMTSAVRDTLTAIDQADPGGEIRTAFEESEACDEVGN